jgi:hypothetical protein
MTDVKRKLKKTLRFTIPSKRRYLEINLTKEIKKLVHENYRISPKKLKT